MEVINFTKMHGISNDYIYINCMEHCPGNLASLSREMSDRHRGVGGDGIILIMPSVKADFKMRIFNADGSEARMCGNGSRCVGKYVYDNKLTDKTTLTLETLSGVVYLHLKPGNDGLVESVTVDMGTPILYCSEIPVISNTDTFISQPIDICGSDTFFVTAVSMGNPHGVIFVDSLDNIDISCKGSALENHPIFPDKANIEFVKIISRDEIYMRVWERGSGETMACGTGACAATVAAVLNNHCNRHVIVHLRGGDLDINWDPDTGHVMMTGTASTVFSGSYIRQSSAEYCNG